MNESQYELLKMIIKKKKIDYLLLASLMPYGLAVWNNEITKNNLNIFFEKDDGAAIVYKTFNCVINEFIKFKLDPCLFLVKFGVKIRQNTSNFIRSFKTSGHYILNNAVIFSKGDSNKFLYYDFNSDFFIENICEYFSSNIDKKIINLKARGYSNIEIAEILNVSSKKIENNLYLIRKKLESNNIKKKLFFE